MTIVAVLGLGEAGALYARGFRDAGYEVAGYDPFTTLAEPGVRQETELAAALLGAELVVSLVGGTRSHCCCWSCASDARLRDGLR